MAFTLVKILSLQLTFGKEMVIVRCLYHSRSNGTFANVMCLQTSLSTLYWLVLIRRELDQKEPRTRYLSALSQIIEHQYGESMTRFMNPSLCHHL